MADDRPAPTAEQIRNLWEALDKPGPEKLQVALRKRGFHSPTVKVLREHFYRFLSSRQVFQRPPRYTGHAYSTGLDDRWMADIMVMPEAEYRGKSYKYALIAVDIFSRFAWAALIDSPMQADEGFGEILRKAGGNGPSTLITDGDPGFKTPGFKKLLGNTTHEIKVGQNDLSIVDRLIGFLKRKYAQAELDEGKAANWAEQLQHRLAGYNHSGAPALYGSDPADLRTARGQIGNKHLYFERLWDESKGMRANAAAIHRRGELLERNEAFRTLAPFPGPKRRVDDPVWSVDTKRVRRVDGAFVEDEEGQRHPTKEILAIPSDSTALHARRAKINARAREALQRYADRARAFLMTQADRRASAVKFYNAVAQVGNVKQALKLAGISTEGVVKSLVGLFQDKFKLHSSKKGGAAFVELIE